MTVAKQRSFTLSSQQAQIVDGLIESGRFATDIEVIAAGLEALQDDDSEFEQWLLREAVPVMTAMEKDPGRALSADEVFAELRALSEKS